jgi:nicotinamidase-related amidase
MMVVYSTTPTGLIMSVPPVLAPKGEETVVHSGVDKFLGTNLEAVLKAKDIHTVIVTGTVAHGAVLYTATAASLRGFKVAVPVDTLSAPDPFAELSATWILSNAPASVAKNMNVAASSNAATFGNEAKQVGRSRSDMIQF